MNEDFTASGRPTNRNITASTPSKEVSDLKEEVSLSHKLDEVLNSLERMRGNFA